MSEFNKALANTNLFSLGKLVVLLQQPVSALESAAKRAGVGPALVLNGVTYFNDRAVVRICKTLTASNRTGRAVEATETNARRAAAAKKRVPRIDLGRDPDLGEQLLRGR